MGLTIKSNDENTKVFVKTKTVEKTEEFTISQKEREIEQIDTQISSLEAIKVELQKDIADANIILNSKE